MERNPNGALKDCPLCHGRGFIYGASLLRGGTSCSCTESFLRSRNLDQVWESLGKVEEGVGKTIPSSLAEKSCWITSTRAVFQQHLKRFILQQPNLWSCKVRTDAELLDAWLGTAKAQGVKIYDLDVSESSIVAIDIRDLVMAPDLCIIWMGVKNLPNKEAPNSLLEAINYRHHVGKPTWVVDQPDKRLDGTHLYYSREFETKANSWPHLVLSKKGIELKNTKPKAPKTTVLKTPAQQISIEEEKEEEEETVEEEAPVSPVTNKYIQGLVDGISKVEAKREAKRSWKR